jgi:hypothetical protein
MTLDCDQSLGNQHCRSPNEKETLPVTGTETASEKHDNDRLEAIEYTLAEFRYKNDQRVVFT